MKSVTFAIMFRWPINSSFMFVKFKVKIKNYLFPIMVGVLCLVAQSCLTLCNSMDYSLPDCSVHGDSPGKNTGVDSHSILQGIFPTWDWTQVSCTAGGFFTIWATRVSRYSTLTLGLGLKLLWESNSAANLAGGRAQMVTQVIGISCK